ncbi:MAG: UDP-glucose 4-epimerase GalE, partial [Oscillospiraceae bacterium]|nr:UDP-glucose 4-epimerase GalE [Oscillospiraceae bacterium]
DAEQKPINPYGQSKLMIEKILADYNKAYGINYCCLRYFNAAGADPDGEIGESHTPETHLIPLVLAASAGDRENIKVFGSDYPTRDGSCIRDYIHVTDLADAHLRAMDYLKKGGESVCMNLGNCMGNSVLEVIEAARKITGKDIPVEVTQRRPGDPPTLVGSAQKAEKLLSWKPKYGDINVILEHAWQWYCNKEY